MPWRAARRDGRGRSSCEEARIRGRPAAATSRAPIDTHSEPFRMDNSRKLDTSLRQSVNGREGAIDQRKIGAEESPLELQRQLRRQTVGANQAALLAGC